MLTVVIELAEWSPIPVTYAGGAKGWLEYLFWTLLTVSTDISDLYTVERLSNGRVDLTYGSSLDVFGGKLVNFEDLVAKSRDLSVTESH